MRLFGNWFGSSKDQENPDSIHHDIESGVVESKEKKETIDNKEEIVREKNLLREILAEMHILTVNALSDEGMYKVKEEGPQAGWFRSRLVVLEKSLNLEELLEYLKTVDKFEVKFRGSLEKVRSVLETISTEWVGKQTSIIIEVSDGVDDCSAKERNEWIQLILRIYIAHYKTYTKMQFTKSVDYYKVARYHQWQTLDDICWRRFLIKCPAMDIPRYDMIRAYVLNGFVVIRSKRDWQLTQKVVRAEAESYEENDNKLEFVMNRRTITATFKEMQI